MSELKKCPFCGSRAKMKEDYDWGTVYICCADEFGICSVLPSTEELYHVHEAVAEWNNRVIEQEIRTKAIEEFVVEAMKQLTELELTDDFPTVTDCKSILFEVVKSMKGEKE